MTTSFQGLTAALMNGTRPKDDTTGILLWSGSRTSSEASQKGTGATAPPEAGSTSQEFRIQF